MNTQTLLLTCDEEKEHSYSVGLDLVLYTVASNDVNNPSVVITARWADLDENCTAHLLFEESKASLKKNFPNLQSLLEYFAFNPEWNEPNIEENFFFINSVKNFDGFYDVPSVSPTYLVLNQNFKNLPEIVAVEPKLEKPNKQKYHQYSTDNLDSKKYEDFEHFSTSVTLFDIVDNSKITGVLAVFFISGVDSYNIIEFTKEDFDKQCATVTGLLESFVFNNPCFEGESDGGNLPLVYLEEITNNNGRYRLNKFAPTYVLDLEE